VRLSTDFLRRNSPAEPAPPGSEARALAALALALAAARDSRAPGTWGQLCAWRLTALAGRGGASWHVVADDDLCVRETPQGHEVTDAEGAILLSAAHARLSGDRLDLEALGRRRHVSIAMTPTEIHLIEGATTLRLPRGGDLTGPGPAAQSGSEISAPMPGLLVELLHPPGTRLKQGDPVLVFEAMKLMQTLTAPCDGILSELPHAAGATVPTGALLARLTPESEPST
jgi:acetyl/propionyl-CoA carboxylase alpha subunit